MLQWNVLCHNINTKSIEVYNIFKHVSFFDDIKKLFKKNLPKDEFALQLKRDVMYYFWSKAEWEIILTSFPTYIDSSELDRLNEEHIEFNEQFGHYPYKSNINLDIGRKIDVYEQIMMNWQVFVDYVWDAKEKRKEEFKIN